MSGGYYRPKGRNTFRVWVPWKGKKLFINQYLDGTPLYSDGQARRVLERIRGEIDQKTFDPANWGKDKAIIFQNAWEIYQKQAPCGETRLEDRERVKRDHLMPYFEDWLLPDIEEHNIKDFFSKLPAHYAPSSLKLILNVLRGFLNYFQITRRKVFRYPKVTIQKKAVLWLSQEDQERVFEFIPVQHRPIFEFIRAYGCRSGEVCNLKKADIDWSKRTITFKERKNAIDNELPIIGEIEKYLVGGAMGVSGGCNAVGMPSQPGLFPPTKVSNLHYVFCTLRGHPYIRQHLLNIWHDANVKAHQKYGVKVLPLKNATRHSLASRLLEEGQPLEVIARILGNSQKVVEQNYGRIRTQKVMGILEGR